MKVYCMTLMCLYIFDLSQSFTWIIPLEKSPQIYFNNPGAFSYGYSISPGLKPQQLVNSESNYNQHLVNIAKNSSITSQNLSQTLAGHKSTLPDSKNFNNLQENYFNLNHSNSNISLTKSISISEADDLNKEEPEENTFDGSYSFSYRTDNSFRQESSDANNNIKGRYFYTDSTGFHDLSYVAGSESGFLTTGGNLARPNGVENSGLVTFYKVPFEPPESNDSSYSFEFSTSDHSRQEIGDKNGNVYGHYSFVNEAGNHDLRYIAGSSTGFLPLGGTLLSSLAVVHCKPQYNVQDSSGIDVGEDNQNKVTLLPFYGGAKGQSLQIVEKPDGTVLTHIIKTPQPKPSPSEEAINASELENPPLPSKQDLTFGSNIRNIHRTALNIIKLQEIAKKNGQLNTNQENIYQQNMDELNNAAKNLAQLQDPEADFSFENREGLTEWFERKKSSNKKDKDKKKKEEEDKKKEEERKKEEEEKKKAEEEAERKRKEEEKNKNQKPKEEEEEEEEEGEDGDAISIGLPPDDASVAEAKPVGLAVAGEGGVAASKPIATAVVGPGGLAIARPVGTAIAGVAPDQALVPIYAEGYIAGTKPKRGGSSNNKSDPTSELLNRIISKYHQI